MTHGTINQMDKELDKDAPSSHAFLDQRRKLVEIKVANPSARILSAADLSNEEKVSVKETKKTGLKAPKKSFMTLRAFKKRFPNKSLDPNSIKREFIDGEWKEGVDIILSEARDFRLAGSCIWMLCYRLGYIELLWIPDSWAVSFLS